MKFPKDHPYMIRLDEALKQYYVCKVIDANGAEHGEDYTQMKEEILNALFHPPVDIRQKEEEKEKMYDFSKQKYGSTPQHVKIPIDE